MSDDYEEPDWNPITLTQDETSSSLPSWVSQYANGWNSDVTSDDESSALDTTYANDLGTAASGENFDDWLSTFIANNPTLGFEGDSTSSSSGSSSGSSGGTDWNSVFGGVSSGTNYSDLLGKVTGTNGSLTGVPGIGDATSKDATDASTSPITGGEGAGSLNSTVGSDPSSSVGDGSSSGSWWNTLSSGSSGGTDWDKIFGGVSSGTNYSDLLGKVTGTNGSLTGVSGIGDATSKDATDASTSPITGGEGSGSLDSTVSGDSSQSSDDSSSSGSWWDKLASAISGAGNTVGSVLGLRDSGSSLSSMLGPSLAALLAQQAGSALSNKAGNAPDASAAVNPALAKVSSNADAQAQFLNGVYDSLNPTVTQQVNSTMSTADQQRKDSAALSTAGNANLNTYASSYQPITQRVAADAAGYSYLSPEEQAAYDKANGTDTDANRLLRQSQNAAETAAANTAGTAVDQNFSNQRAEANRKLSAMGINPNSGRAIDLTNRDLDIAQAVGKSGAEWKARTDAKESGIKARQTAATEGQSILAAGNQLLSNSSSIGTQATTNASAGVDLATKTANVKNAGFDVQNKADTTAVSAGLQLADLNANNWKTQAVIDQANAIGYGKVFGGLASSLFNNKGTTGTTVGG